MSEWQPQVCLFWSPILISPHSVQKPPIHSFLFFGFSCPTEQRVQLERPPNPRAFGPPPPPAFFLRGGSGKCVACLGVGTNPALFLARGPRLKDFFFVLFLCFLGFFVFPLSFFFLARKRRVGGRLSSSFFLKNLRPQGCGIKGFIHISKARASNLEANQSKPGFA